MSEGLRYRGDIDGVRGVAIGAVVTYHLWPRALPGGFTGVDVFFVISGFLITRHLRQTFDGGLRIRDFYARRVRRLFPALLLTLAAVLLLGSGLLLDTEWRELGKHAVGGLTFVSNVVLFLEGGYFDLPAAFKPLHHLWSLAIEEQFYIFWPWLLWFGNRLGRRSLAMVIVAVVAVSFAANLAATRYDTNEAFYLPSGRVWELALGGLLSFFQLNRRLSFGAGLLGAALLLAGFVGTSELEFPGYQVLLPTLGAAALISSEGGGVKALLTSRLLVGLGHISYPLYLWHWPLLVFARLARADFLPADSALPLVPSLVILFASVGLSIITWRFVEQPVRQRKAVPVAGLLAMAVVLLGFSLSVMTGVLRTPASSNEFAAVYANVHLESLEPEVMPLSTSVPPFTRAALDERPPEIAFVGDSAMAQFSLTVLKRAHQGPHRPFMFLTTQGCSPFMSAELSWCREVVSVLKHELAAPSLKTIVIASQWAHYFDNPMVVWRGEKVVPETGYGRDSLVEFKNWVAELSRTHSVIVVMNTPVGLEVDPRRMVHRRWWSNPVIDDAPYPRAELEAFVQRANGAVRQAAFEGGASIIDPFDWLCDASSCARAEAGFPLYRDTDHVRATTLAARFRAFDALLDE